VDSELKLETDEVLGVDRVESDSAEEVIEEKLDAEEDVSVETVLEIEVEPEFFD
jgi:hypothetical protein